MPLNETHLDDRWDAFTRRLFQQNRFAIKLGLDSMNRALHMCGRTTLTHRVVLVAGTNGKGTTASSLSSLLTCAGLKVGFYSSPHLVDFTERFRVNGKILPREDVLDVGEAIIERFADPEKQPCLTFFELTTLMAVELFERAQVDVAVYEVGLGGRLDATNALEPDACVLTSIGYDHQEYLGDSLDTIASEKLGIVRRDTPLFVSLQDHREVDIFLTVLAHTPLYVFHRNFGLTRDFDPEQHHFPLAAHPDSIWWYARGERCTLAIKNWGVFRQAYQRAHLATALVTADHIMKKWFDERDDSKGMDGWRRSFVEHIPLMSWPGRMQTIEVTFDGFNDDSRGEGGSHNSAPATLELLCDAAHNADGASALFDALDASGYRPDIILCSFLRDKDVAPMLTRFKHWLESLARRAPDEIAPELFSVVLDNPRASSARALADAFDQQQIELSESPAGIAESLRQVRHHVGDREKVSVLVFGSMYLLGELWSALRCEDVAFAPLIFEREES